MVFKPGLPDTVLSSFDLQSTSVAAPSLHAALLAPLGEEERRALLAAFRARRYRAGEALFHEGDPGHLVYFIQSGRVKIVRVAHDGTEAILCICGPGECLGEFSVVDDGPRSAGAVTMERVDVLALHREEFRALLMRHPTATLALLTAVIGKTRQLNEQLQALLSLDAPGRIARKLLDLAEQHGEPTPRGVRIGIRLTQGQLAAMVGVARTTVNKQLARLQERGILSHERAWVTLHHPERLRKWLR